MPVEVVSTRAVATLVALTAGAAAVVAVGGGPVPAPVVGEVDGGIVVVEEGYDPPRPDCATELLVTPMIAADTVGLPTRRDAVLAAFGGGAGTAGVVGSTVVEIGQVSEGRWAVLHEDGAVTTVVPVEAPRGGWIVAGHRTCSPTAADGGEG